MKRLLRSAVSIAALVALAPAASLAELPSTAAAASRVTASTVTVRIWPKADNAANDAAQLGERAPANGAASNGQSGEQTPGANQTAGSNGQQLAANSASQMANSAPQVIVSSGVCVGPGLVITAGHPLVEQTPAEARYRITHCDGRQAKATLCVLDHYSNLCLLKADGEELPALELAADLPAVGETILTAAAAGIERPAVSVGTLGAVDRSAGNSGLPPLLQCDLRTTEASGGAAVVDAGGKLIGIVMAIDLAGEGSGWTFAVPLRHVRRVLDARRPDEVVVLQRRRPTLGLTLGQGPKEGTVIVERVVPGGPADQGGIRQGDLLLEAGGRKIRSAYQAVDLILTRQPGEKIALVIDRAAEQRAVNITLAGDSATVTRRDANQAYTSPQVNVRVIGRNQIEVTNSTDQRAAANGRARANVAELAAGANQAPPRVPRDELTMLQAQLAAFEKVIVKLQAELRHRDQLLEETNGLVKSLSAEVETLRKQQTPAK